VFICGASSGFSLRLCDSAVKIALFFGSWILVFGFWRTLFQRIRVFRPCIDLHEGKVKQIVGGTLSDSGAGLRTNFVSEKSAAWFADLYRRDELRGDAGVHRPPPE
jgi:hypothetical protein